MKVLSRVVVALVAVLALPVQAMQLDPDGQGEILIYPYFSAQDSEGNDFNTYLSVVNSSPDAKALRVRFREGRNGHELMSFNLLLEPQGTWTAVVVPRTGGAGFITTDLSCTAPVPVSSVPFSANEYTGAFDDGLGFDAARQREGYVEIFEMASFSGSAAMSCEQFRSSALPVTLQRPSGGLSGTLTLINVQSGLDFTVNATAISDAATGHYFRAPGDPYPDYNAAEIAPVATFFVGDDHLYRTTWVSPVQALNATLMVQAVMNEVILDRGTASGTDFVLTMPTRRMAGNAPPFHAFPEGSRDLTFGIDFNDREKRRLSIFSGTCPFLCPPGFEQAHMALRFATNVVGFRTTSEHSTGAPGVSDVLGSRNAWLVGMHTDAQNGAVSLALDSVPLEAPFPHLHHRIYPNDGTSVDARPSYWGLPVIGFMVRTFRNGTLSCGSGACQGNYGGAFPHKYKRVAYPP
jgi:hypothetical protein